MGRRINSILSPGGKKTKDLAATCSGETFLLISPLVGEGAESLPLAWEGPNGIPPLGGDEDHCQSLPGEEYFHFSLLPSGERYSPIIPLPGEKVQSSSIPPPGGDKRLPLSLPREGQINAASVPPGEGKTFECLSPGG